MANTCLGCRLRRCRLNTLSLNKLSLRKLMARSASWLCEALSGRRCEWLCESLSGRLSSAVINENKVTWHVNVIPCRFTCSLSCSRNVWKWLMRGDDYEKLVKLCGPQHMENMNKYEKYETILSRIWKNNIMDMKSNMKII